MFTQSVQVFLRYNKTIYLSLNTIYSSQSTVYILCCYTRAFSLRNLVFGYECRGSLLIAGVGLDSPSRDATNQMSSRFTQSVKTRRRYGWLRMMVFPGLVVLYRVGTHQIRRRRRAARSLTSQGRAEPLCARITGLNREVSEGKADL